MKIFPIDIPKETIHHIQIRLSRGRWRSITHFQRERIQGSFNEKKNKPIYYFRSFIISKKKFNQARIDGEYIIKFRPVNKKSLALIFSELTKERISNVWKRIQNCRDWAEKENLSPGGSPLPETKHRLYVTCKPSRIKFLKTMTPGNLKDDIQNYYQYRFLKNLGIGDVWGYKWKQPRSIKLWGAFYTQTPWRGYIGDIPRFFIKTRYYRLSDIFQRVRQNNFNQDWLSPLGRSLIFQFFLTYSTQQSKKKADGLGAEDMPSTSVGEETDQVLYNFPIGVVGWKFIR